MKCFKHNILILYIHLSNINIYFYYIDIVASFFLHAEQHEGEYLMKYLKVQSNGILQNKLNMTPCDISMVEIKSRFGHWTVNHIKSSLKIYYLMQNACTSNDQKLEIQFFSTFRFFTLSPKRPHSPLCAYLGVFQMLLK